MSYLKPQNPIKLNNDYIYPLTTADQVITGSGERLNSLFKKTVKENATLQVANWSKTAPYTQTITLTESTDDYNVDANVAYSDGDNAALHAAAGCISYIKKNHKNITFYCLKNKPEIDIPIEINGTCRNTIATIEEGVKLNFDIVGGTTQPVDPIENTIWVNTDVPITGYYFSATEPKNMNNGEVWIKTGLDSNVSLNILNNTTLYPINAMQYINNELVYKDTKSYQNNEWVDWTNELFLYDQGKEFEGITGGWDISEHGTYGGGAVKAENHIAIGVTPGDYGGGATITHNPILLTGKTQLIIDCNIASDDIRIGITTDNINVYKSGSDLNFISYLTATQTSGINRFTLPIDGNSIMSGYIAVQAWSTTCHIYSIKLV